jgi:hypothetical protein
MCDCLQLEIFATTGTTTYVEPITGTFNSAPYWYFTHDGQDIYIFSVDATGSTWVYAPQLGFSPFVYGRYIPPSPTLCPTAGLSPVPTDPTQGWENLGNFPNLKVFETQGVTCPEDNCGNQDRTRKYYNSIRLPEVFQEQDRGLKDCCCKYKVLGDASGDTFKNDKTSAWIKLSDTSDTATFVLKKNGIATTYTPTSNVFINESNARYTTIDWGSVLASDGVGCYKLEIEYNISGIIGTILWGTYELEPYTIQNAINTARVRAIFNGYQEIEQINFSGSEVESTFRFCGYIGNRQPNTEIDNIIYQNREMKRVIRENLNSYEIITDPSDECITRPLIDLFLLSENQLFISDYNAHNHSYRYQDIEVIVDESPSVEYYDFSRKAKVTCKVSDKYKNKRTYYK